VLPQLVALLLAAAPQDTLLDVPFYEDAAFGVRLKRPFEDWVFAPASTPGTTTVIFHPLGGVLGEQLWGALVLARWGRPVPLGEVASQRVSTMWRTTLGSSFSLLTRDSITVAGLPAIHVVMSGAISHAVLEVEEYLIARDSDLVLLQFRYPRGLPRDSVAAGYERSLAGLLIRSASPRGAVAATLAAWSLERSEDGLRFELPDSLRAVAPGTLTAEAVAGGRRRMRWTWEFEPPDSALYAVGSFRVETQRLGRLTVRGWRLPAHDSGAVRVTGAVLATIERGWAFFWRLFGPVPRTEVALVETAWPHTRGATGVVFLGRDADQVTPVLRELARTWWGGYLAGDSGAARLVREILPEWAGLTARAALDSAAAPEGRWSAARSGAVALERARHSSGRAAFAEALRSFAAQARTRSGSIESLLRPLEPDAAAALRAAASQR
jgi:hypothetical protein